MNILNVISKLPWKGSNGNMSLKNIDTLVVHHDAVAIPAAYDTMQRIQSEAAYHVKVGWKHLAYHYMIDNVGDIYQCVPEKEIGYHAGNYTMNQKSIAVCLHGNFETQNPTAAQKKALREFCEMMFTKRPDLPKLLRTGLKMHKEVRIQPTSCPGRNLIPTVKEIRNNTPPTEPVCTHCLTHCPK